jgi:hypothetical protein
MRRKLFFYWEKKLDSLAKLLDFYPYNKKSTFKGQLKAVSHSKVQSVLVICPDAVVYQSFPTGPFNAPAHGFMLQKLLFPFTFFLTFPSFFFPLFSKASQCFSKFCGLGRV